MFDPLNQEVYLEGPDSIDAVKFLSDAISGKVDSLDDSKIPIIDYCRSEAYIKPYQDVFFGKTVFHGSMVTIF